MRINLSYVHQPDTQKGVSLIELVAFLVVVGVAAAGIFGAYNYSVMNNIDPAVEVRVLEAAQSKLDEILALKYDANTPTGGIPACGSTGGVACNNAPDADMNDVDDFNNYSDAPYPNYTRTVTVVTASNKKLISVTVTAPQPRPWSVTLAAYKANF